MEMKYEKTPSGKGLFKLREGDKSNSLTSSEQKLCIYYEIKIDCTSFFVTIGIRK